VILGEPNIDDAAKNVSTLLNMDFGLVREAILSKLSNREPVEKFFVYRSLIGQVNLSDCEFSNLEEEKRLNVLRAYIQRHFDIGIGDYFPRPGMIVSKFTPQFYNTLKTNSFDKYIEGVVKTTDCLFPKKDIRMFTDLDLVWSAVASKWLHKDYKRISVPLIPNHLANVYGINQDSRAYQTFMMSCLNDRLYQAVKLTPLVISTRNTTWGTYRDVPIAMPPSCVSPLGFDFMAYQMYGYVDGMDFTRIWSE